MEKKHHNLWEIKDFNELTNFEKEVTLQEVTEEEYFHRRTTVLQIKKQLNEESQYIKANPSIRSNALAALKQQKIASSPIRILFSLKVPAWSAVAAVFIAFFSVIPFVKNTNNKSITTANTNKKIDTVYVQQIIHDTIEKESEHKKSTLKKVFKVSEVIHEKTAATYFKPSLEDSMCNQIRREMELQELQPVFSTTSNRSGQNIDEDKISKYLINRLKTTNL